MENKRSGRFRIHAVNTAGFFVFGLALLMMLSGLTVNANPLGIVDRLEHSGGMYGTGNKVTAQPMVNPQPLQKISLEYAFEKNGQYVVNLGNDTEAVLSLEPFLQHRAERFLKKSRVPFGAIVAIEPRTGRVLAYASYSEFDPKGKFYNISKAYKAASLFKIITAEAILSEKKVPVDEELCYHGGRSRLSERLLKDNPRMDHRCMTFEQAMGHSANVIFARLAYKNLTPDTLKRHAGMFFFGEDIPFEVPIDRSIANIPDDPEEMAITSAGFGDVRITPIHAAMIAGAVGNYGDMMRPTLVDSIREVGGRTLSDSVQGTLGNVSNSKTAGLLSSMMYTTTTEGTARKAFRKKGGSIDFKNDIPIAGKTGSLSDREPFMQNLSWYAGFGPVEDPQIAVAVLIVNHRVLKTKASYAARDLLEEYFKNLNSVASVSKYRQYAHKN